MGIIGFITSMFALSPAEEQRHHEIMVEYGLEEPTAAERRSDEAEETAAYIDHIKSLGGTMRESWIQTSDGLMHWQEYVIDQHGKKHITSEGSHYCGYVEGQTTVIPVIDGIVVDDEAYLVKREDKRKYLPVYKRLQGKNY